MPILTTTLYGVKTVDKVFGCRLLSIQKVPHYKSVHSVPRSNLPKNFTKPVLLAKRRLLSMRIAKRDDFYIKPMPSAFTTILVEKFYSQEEFDHITSGLIPRDMDYKWFIFYESPWLYLHRSWSGYCIFKVRFEPVAEGAKIVEVIVNRDSSQYKETDDERAIDLLEKLLDSIKGQFNNL